MTRFVRIGEPNGKGESSHCRRAADMHPGRLKCLFSLPVLSSSASSLAVASPFHGSECRTNEYEGGALPALSETDANEDRPQQGVQTQVGGATQEKITRAEVA